MSLGYPNNPVFIDKHDLGKLGTTCDKPALKKIISEAKTSNYDVDLFNGVMIPSFSAEYYHLTFHKILSEIYSLIQSVVSTTPNKPFFLSST